MGRPPWITRPRHVTLRLDGYLGDELCRRAGSRPPRAFVRDVLDQAVLLMQQGRFTSQ